MSDIAWIRTGCCVFGAHNVYFRQSIRIRPYELEEIRRAYINNLYQLAGFFFGEESLDAAVLGGIARLDCCDEVRFSFGGYMDQTIQFALFRKGDEHEILSPENRPKV